MIEARWEYIHVREVIARDLKVKFNLMESYKDDERLTLDSTDYSFHLVFYIPDEPEIYVTKNNKLPAWDNSFIYFFFKKYPDSREQSELLKKMFQRDSNKNLNLYERFSVKINFLEKNYPFFFG